MAINSWRIRSLKAVLREALKSSGVSAREAGRRLDVSHMRVSRWLDDDEPAPTAADVARFLTAIVVVGEEYDRIVAMAEATGDDWLVSGPPGINPQLAAVLACERDAIRITECAPSVFPGLLQIRDYARSIIATGGSGLAAQEVETRVMMRIARGDAVTRRTKPVKFDVLIGLQAIHANVGGPQIMADQLAHVADLGQRDNITIQAVDMSGDWTPAHAGAFVIYEFDGMPTAVYLEHYRSGALVVEEDDVAAYQTAAETLRRVAMSPDDTARLIASVIPDSMETTK